MRRLRERIGDQVIRGTHPYPSGLERALLAIVLELGGYLSLRDRLRAPQRAASRG